MMKNRSIISVLVSCFVFDICICDSYRILGVFPLNVKSHFIMFDDLMQGLAKRGHNVDIISFFPPSKLLPNYNHIIKFESQRGNPTNNLTWDEVESVGVLEYIATIHGNELCKELGHPEILKLVHNPPDNPPYKLLITEIFGADCFIALSHMLKIPVVGITSAELYPWMNDFIANPENLAWVPNTMLSDVHEEDIISSFLWRLYNLVMTVYMKMKFNYMTSFQDNLIHKHFGTNVPGVRKLETNLALVLANYHISLSNIQPTTPAIIQVGGLHLWGERKKTTLPQNLRECLDNATYGFIYFSFGSMLRIESLPENIMNTFMKSFTKIGPIKVLMKVEDTKLLPKNMSTNIHTFSWIPQVQILQHRNIKAFITHGGILGTQEAVYYGVPMIGIPLFADQFKNINNYIRLNISLKLNIKSITEETLDFALQEILHNPIYRNSMKHVSAMYRDRPLSPLDTACYWIEYVIKYGDQALKSPALQLSWWQISHLDIYVFLIGCLFVILHVIKIFLQNICNTCQQQHKYKKN